MLRIRLTNKYDDSKSMWSGVPYSAFGPRLLYLAKNSGRLCSNHFHLMFAYPTAC